MAFVSAVTHLHTPLSFSVFLFPRDRPFVFWVKGDILGHDEVVSVPQSSEASLSAHLRSVSGLGLSQGPLSFQPLGSRHHPGVV